jgi:hypothetical protein
MTPVDTFLHSVRGAFSPSPTGEAGWLWAAFGLAVLLAILGQRWWAIRARGRAAKMAFARLLAERRLSAAEGRLLERLGKLASVAPVLVATHLDVFERATGRELATHTPTTASGTHEVTSAASDDVFAHVHRLRRALGFHVVPEHLPMLTTRELVPGTPVEVTGFLGEVIEVNEAWFAVIAAPDTTFVTGAPDKPTRLTFTRDARYAARCFPLSAEPARAPRKLVLRHDEHPERHQLRAAVRVNAPGTVRLSRRPGEAATGNGAGPEQADAYAASGSLVDISIGGLAVAWPGPLSVGASPHVTVEWNAEVYQDLPAVILRCDARPGGRFLVRLEFRGLPAAEEARLAAAVARHSARPEESSRGA